MVSPPSLLVVDDEALYCEACRRIFSGQGFHVDQSNDAGAGLKLAQDNDYAAILLDVKMPTMDGVEFLRQLRSAKPDVPVIMMTGFPSIPDAASAVRLKASDYVTKPFTPEEITEALHKLLGQVAGADGKAAAEDWTSKSAEFRFLGKAWAEEGSDGSVRCGAVLPGGRLGEATKLLAPRIGEVVFRGLPLFALERGETSQTVASPVSGVVTSVNSSVVSDPKLLAVSPCGEGWVATIAPTRPEEYQQQCRLRRVILAAGEAAAKELSARLRQLGCAVEPASSGEELQRLAAQGETPVVVLDEASFGDDGPAMVGQVKSTLPAIKILVLGLPDGDRETAFRERKIFYYAVCPFDDSEIVEILDAAFCPELRSNGKVGDKPGPSEPVNGIHIKGRHGRKVCLLVPGGVLKTSEGLGKTLRKRLLDELLPIETYVGDAPLGGGDVLKATSSSDHVFVLEVKDIGRLPGCLVRDVKGQYEGVADGATSDKLTALIVQPGASGNLADLPPAVLQWLAEHITAEMVAAWQGRQ